MKKCRKPFSPGKESGKLIEQDRQLDKRAQGSHDDLHYGISRNDFGLCKTSFSIRDHPYLAIAIIGMLVAMPAIAGCADLHDSPTHYNPMEKLEKKISQSPPAKDNISQKYGLVVSGFTENENTDSIGMAYRLMRERGFEENDIFVLDSDGVERGSYPVDSPSTAEAFRKVVNYLSAKVGTEDKLFVYISDHGTRDKPKTSLRGTEIKELKSYVALYDSLVSDREFADYMQQINPGEGILLAEQCYGGGFSKEVGKGNFTAVSPSGPNEPSLIFSDYDSFAKCFLESFEKNESDTDDDGRVSLKEAFKYASEKDIASAFGYQTPCLYSDKDPAKVFLD